MIIKRIVLNNIRSYEKEEIVFKSGSTLLSGDIGSGKTSVLLAVEFALFGLQPGQRGGAILRNGTNEGSVLLEIDIDGQDIIIERTLKRGSKTITQDYCAITIEGVTKEIAVTELKDKVLEILNYPKEFQKKQNLLYKFTVYTPQEEMKAIIMEDPDTRINTLRHVFGVDKYKKILENVAILATKIREEKRLREGQTSSLENDKIFLISKEEDLESKHHNLSSVEKELFLKQEKRKKIQEEKEEISKKKDEKTKLHQEIEKTKLVILNKKETTSSNSKTMDELKSQIRELAKLKVEESDTVKIKTELEVKKQEKKKTDEKRLEVSSEIASINSKNDENKRIEENLSHLDICPTCLQEVDPNYKANVLLKINSSKTESSKRLKELTEEKRKLLEMSNLLDDEISGLDKRQQELNIMKIKVQGIDEKNKRLMEIEKSNALLYKDIEILNQHLESLNESIFDLKKYDIIFEQKQKEFDESMKEERAAEIKVAELKKEIEMFSKQIDELKERIKKTEEIKARLDYMSEVESWLSKKFVPVVSFIERNVMLTLKSEFSNLFAEWFYILVSDNFSVRLNDDFTPIIEQHDYELDYQYLSGGERTAIALAYRLSLNQVINSMLSRIKTRDLVILDEPTDGFSEQQLDKMRDVLNQLKVKQLIIVSHEQKIEGFVQNVIRFRKEKGISMKEEV
ncbi:MAG: AAA family ATPase [Candidatus Pacearchaeota archaeon]